MDMLMKINYQDASFIRPTRWSVSKETLFTARQENKEKNKKKLSL